MKRLKIISLWIFCPFLLIPILAPIFGAAYCGSRAAKWLDSCIHWHISDNETLTRVWECAYPIDNLTAILHIGAWSWLAIIILLLAPASLGIYCHLANKLEF